jgi:hypothetical protein
VEKEDATYVATVEGLSAFHPRVQGAGDSPDVAREELVQAMLTWISARDCSDSMADALAVAGFPEIDDETELQLEFDYSMAPDQKDAPVRRIKSL